MERAFERPGHTPLLSAILIVPDTRGILMSERSEQKFSEQARQGQSSLLRETFAWLRYNKKWWLAPVVALLLLVGVLVILSSTAVAPLIYTLF